MDTYFGMLYRNVMNGSFSAPIDRYTVCLTVTINNATCKVIIASDSPYIISPMGFAEANHSLIATPIIACFQYSIG